MSGSEGGSVERALASQVDDRESRIERLSAARVEIPVPTSEQRQYLDHLQRVSKTYDPNLIVGGPRTVSSS